jgi:hypothetical protein
MSSKCFWNQTFDKGRLKNFVLWFLKNYGEHKTVELVEELKNIGFQYATKAGISLGIEDLKIPKKKYSLIMEAEQLSIATIKQYKRGEITGVERFQRLIDTWHRTSERLKQEVIDNFEATDILNPVYMMAFSGARGNISQVRQLVGMRGLMSNPQGQIIDFPIRSNFREGLTLTEYLISSYGARKGIVDTALRTANAGYLTRRLVDVAQHVIISNFDCGTKRGIFLNDMKEGNKTIYSLQNRLIGRVLAQDIYNKQKIKIASKNSEISVDLASAIALISKKVFVRSALTCQTKKLVCQLCYGWSLAQGNLVSIGEAVGVVAAQSIGEPGTQLTMRTFHTGGVFSGDVSDQIRAPFDGIVEYNNPIAGTLIRTPEGKIAFLTKNEGSFTVHRSLTLHHLVLDDKYQMPKASGVPRKDIMEQNNEKPKKFKIPFYTLLFLRNGEKVTEKEVIAQISSINRQKNATDQAELTIKSEFSGQFYSKILDLKENKVGPKSKNERTNEKLTAQPDAKHLNKKTVDTVFEAWGWGYAWVLAGKIYQLPLPSSFFPIFGDYVNKKTYMNQINWNIASSFGTSFKLHIPTSVGSLSKKLLNKKVIKQMRKYQNSNSFNHDTRHGLTLLKNELISFQLSKIVYKKIGYFLKLTEPSSSFSFNTHNFNNYFKSSEIYASLVHALAKEPLTEETSILSINDPLFLFSSLFSKKMNNLSSLMGTGTGFSRDSNEKKEVYPSQWKSSQASDLFLNWFPKRLSTKTGGLIFMEPLFFGQSPSHIVHNRLDHSTKGVPIGGSTLMLMPLGPKQYIKNTNCKANYMNIATNIDITKSSLKLVDKAINNNMAQITPHQISVLFFPTFVKRDRLTSQKQNPHSMRLGSGSSEMDLTLLKQPTLTKFVSSTAISSRAYNIQLNIISQARLDYVKSYAAYCQTGLDDMATNISGQTILSSSKTTADLAKILICEQYQQKQFGTFLYTGLNANKNKTKSELLTFGLTWKNSFKLNNIPALWSSSTSPFSINNSLNSLNSVDSSWQNKASCQNDFFLQKDNNNNKLLSLQRIFWVAQPFYNIPLNKTSGQTIFYTNPQFNSTNRKKKNSFYSSSVQPILYQMSRQGQIKSFYSAEGHIQTNTQDTGHLVMSSDMTSASSFGQSQLAQPDALLMLMHLAGNPLEYQNNKVFKKEGVYYFRSFNTKLIPNLIKRKKMLTSCLFRCPSDYQDPALGYSGPKISLKTFSKIASFPNFLKKKSVRFIKKNLFNGKNRDIRLSTGRAKQGAITSRTAAKLGRYNISSSLSLTKNKDLKSKKRPKTSNFLNKSLFNFYFYSLFNKNYQHSLMFSNHDTQALNSSSRSFSILWLQNLILLLKNKYLKITYLNNKLTILKLKNKKGNRTFYNKTKDLVTQGIVENISYRSLSKLDTRWYSADPARCMSIRSASGKVRHGSRALNTQHELSIQGQARLGSAKSYAAKSYAAKSYAAMSSNAKNTYNANKHIVVSTGSITKAFSILIKRQKFKEICSLYLKDQLSYKLVQMQHISEPKLTSKNNGFLFLMSSSMPSRSYQLNLSYNKGYYYSSLEQKFLTNDQKDYKSNGMNNPFYVLSSTCLSLSDIRKKQFQIGFRKSKIYKKTYLNFKNSIKRKKSTNAALQSRRVGHALLIPIKKKNSGQKRKKITKSNQDKSLLNIMVKPGWLYYTTHLSLSSLLLYTKKIIQPGKNIGNELVFDRHSIFIEIISLDKIALRASKNKITQSSSKDNFKQTNTIINFKCRFEPQNSEIALLSKAFPSSYKKQWAKKDCHQDKHFFVLIRKASEYKLFKDIEHKKEIYKLSNQKNNGPALSNLNAVLLSPGPVRCMSIRNASGVYAGGLLQSSSPPASLPVCKPSLGLHSGLKVRHGYAVSSEPHNNIVGATPLSCLDNFLSSRHSSCCSFWGSYPRGCPVSWVPPRGDPRIGGIRGSKQSRAGRLKWINKSYNTINLYSQYKTALLNKQKITSQTISKYPSSDLKVFSNISFYSSLSLLQQRTFSVSYNSISPSLTRSCNYLENKGCAIPSHLVITPTNKSIFKGQHLEPNFCLKINKRNAWGLLCLPITATKAINFSPLIITYKVPYSLDFPFKTPMRIFSEQFQQSLFFANENSNVTHNHNQDKLNTKVQNQLYKTLKINNKHFRYNDLKKVLYSYLLKINSNNDFNNRSCSTYKNLSLVPEKTRSTLTLDLRSVGKTMFGLSSIFACPIVEYSLGKDFEKSISYPNNLIGQKNSFGGGSSNFNNVDNKRTLFGTNGPVLGSLNLDFKYNNILTSNKLDSLMSKTSCAYAGGLLSSPPASLPVCKPSFGASYHPGLEVRLDLSSCQEQKGKSHFAQNEQQIRSANLYKTQFVSFINNCVSPQLPFIKTYTYASFEGELIYRNVNRYEKRQLEGIPQRVYYQEGVERSAFVKKVSKVLSSHTNATRNALVNTNTSEQAGKRLESKAQGYLSKEFYSRFSRHVSQMPKASDKIRLDKSSRRKFQSTDNNLNRLSREGIEDNLTNDLFANKNVNNSCLILTKDDQISFYFPFMQNMKEIYISLENLKKKNQYVINDLVINFLNILSSQMPEASGAYAGGLLQRSSHLVSLPEQNNNIGPAQNEVNFKINKLPAGQAQQTSQLLIGEFLVYGDQISPTVAIPKSGQIIHINNQKITIRQGQPIFVSPKAILHKYDGDFIDEQSSVITLSYQQLKTGDIIQGIPKVEQFFEARTTKRGRLFRDSLANLLKGLFKRYRSKLPLNQAVRQSFYKIQQIIVDGVQRVYRSQGVTIADKHLEVIVKQMTSKVRIIEGGQTGFFPGEIVDLDFVEKVNSLLMKKIIYEPLVLGITKASLEVDSFLSAASFQQTTRVLSKAAISRKKDFLKGLKENVILGNLIPAGTGYLVYLDQH